MVVGTLGCRAMIEEAPLGGTCGEHLKVPRILHVESRPRPAVYMRKSWIEPNFLRASLRGRGGGGTGRREEGGAAGRAKPSPRHPRDGKAGG